MKPFSQSWDIYFRNVNNDAKPGDAYQQPPALGGSVSMVPPSSSGRSGALMDDVAKHLSVQALIRGYQVMWIFSFYKLYVTLTEDTT